MNRPWTDEKSGLPLFDKYVTEVPSYKKVLRDGFVTHEEICDQEQKVAGLIQQFEGMLAPDEKAVATALLCEWAVLNAMKEIFQKAANAEPIQCPE